MCEDGTRLHTMIFHQGLHLFWSAFVPLSDVHVQRIVAAGLAISPLSPLFESSNQADARLRHHVVDYKTQTGHLQCYNPRNSTTVHKSCECV